MFDHEQRDVLVNLGNGEIVVLETDSAEQIRASSARITRIEIGDRDVTDQLAGAIGWLDKDRVSTTITRPANVDANRSIYLAIDTSNEDGLRRLFADSTEPVRVYCKGAEAEQIGDPEEDLVGTYRIIIQENPNTPVRITWNKSSNWTSRDNQTQLGVLTFANGSKDRMSRFIELTMDVPGPQLEQGEIFNNLVSVTDGSGRALERYFPDNRSDTFKARKYAVFGPVDIDPYKNEQAIISTEARLASARPRLRIAVRQPEPERYSTFHEQVDLLEDRRAELPSLITPSPRDPDIPSATLDTALFDNPDQDEQSAILDQRSIVNGGFQPIPRISAQIDEQRPEQDLPKTPNKPRRSLLSSLFGTRGILGDWRVGLLALTGLALSVASGITTWDGMTNFTNNAGLSFLITFGIQGVMLIAAFIIGKTFVDGIRKLDEDQHSATGDFAKTLFGLFALVSLVGLAWAGLTVLSTGREFWEVVAPALSAGSTLTGVIAIAALVALLLTAFRNVAAIRPYIGGLSIVVANLPLWTMFLICMAISVFFSFDSLFNQILPQEARIANANIRMQSEVPDLVRAIANKTEREQKSGERALLTSKGWSNLNATLDTLLKEAEDVQQKIRTEEDQRIEQQSKQQAQTKAAIETSKFQIDQRKTRIASLNSQLEAIRQKLTAAQSALTAAEAQLVARNQELRTAQAASEAEARGVDGTGKAGRGPAWRALKEEEKKVEFRRDLAAADVKRARDAAAALDAQSKALLEQQANLIEERLQFEERMTVAQQKSGLTEQQRTAQLEQTFSSALSQLPLYRESFLKQPTEDNFLKMQGACKVLLTGLTQQGSTVPENRDCQLDRATSTAQRLFALNTGLEQLKAKCPAIATTTKLDADALLARAQTCLDTSALTGNDAKPYRDRLRTLKLSRDDQANNFVVTINSFQDGNRLAYLALGIALAIDLLVFMSGLFSARVSGDTGHTITTLPDQAFARELRPIGNEVSSEMNFGNLIRGIRPAHEGVGDDEWTHHLVMEYESSPVVRRIVLAAAAYGWVQHRNGETLIHKNAWNKICDGREVAWKRSQLDEPGQPATDYAPQVDREDALISPDDPGETLPNTLPAEPGGKPDLKLIDNTDKPKGGSSGPSTPTVR